LFEQAAGEFTSMNLGRRVKGVRFQRAAQKRLAIRRSHKPLQDQAGILDSSQRRDGCAAGAAQRLQKGAFGPAGNRYRNIVNID